MAKTAKAPWRSKYAPGAKLKLMVRGNPHRAGTKDNAKWRKLRSGATVRAAAAKVDFGYLRYIEQRGLVEIS